MVRVILILCVIALSVFVIAPCRHCYSTPKGEVAEAQIEPIARKDSAVSQGSQQEVKGEVVAEPDVVKEEDWKGRIQVGKRTKVTWEDLYEFDYKKGVATPFLEAIQGKPSRLPGFVIPLTDGEVENLREFLIVPEPMMCLHVPPPPPNLLLYGTADPPITITSLWDPLWLDGEIKIEKKESIYAVAGFTMKVTGFEPYEELG